MPIVPENVSDLQFDVKDLYLDVRLTTISNEGTVETDPDTGLITSSVEDFTGMPTFETGFFRESVGFGITNIKVETNTSLQPIVEIEFKDLFGKTVFGELNEVETGVNYAALFQWPPPKFVFTFKGYLGSPVTWLLNMKTTSTQYNSDDGSYTLKATFVPNQWGMFSDIPFLYLYAVKKLRADKVDPSISKESPEYIEATESIIDLMYIGKQIQVETKNFTKEYDDIIGQLESLKRDPIQAIVSGILSLDGEQSKIISKTPGRAPVPGFQDIAITTQNLQKQVKNKDIYDTEPEILYPALKSLSVSLRNVENYKVKIAAYQSVVSSFKSRVKVDFGQVPTPEDLERLKEDSKKINDVIDKNIELIDKAIKGNLYNEKKDQLAKLVISTVFTRIAKDTGYIMGYIIDAGEQGYLNNLSVRDKAEKEVTIGKYYPMIFEEAEDGTKDIGKQVPAVKVDVPIGPPPESGVDTRSTESVELGTPNFEKLFITDFITAISFGIAENRALQAEASLGGDSKIKNIINNLEIGTENPFIGVTDWSDMASIILKRGAIAGFLTQSFIPSLPGNMEPNGDTEFSTGDYKKIYDSEKIQALADSDLANINDTVLNQLDTDGLTKLKEFCDVMIAWIKNPTAEDTPMWNYTIGGAMKSLIIINPGLPSLAKGTKARRVMRDIKTSWEAGDKWLLPIMVNAKYTSLIDRNRNQVDRSQDGVAQDCRNAGLIIYTFEEFMGNFIGAEKFFFGGTTAQKYNAKIENRGGNGLTPVTYGNGISFKKCVGSWVGMNGVVFAHTCHNTGYGKGGDGNAVEYVVYSATADLSRVGESLDSPQAQPKPPDDDDDEKQGSSEEVDEDIATPVRLAANLVPEATDEPNGDKIVNQFLEFFNMTLAEERDGVGTGYSLLNYTKASSQDMRLQRDLYYNPQTFSWRQWFGPTPEDLLENDEGAARGNYRNVNNQPVIIAPYAQYPSRDEANCLLVPAAGGIHVLGNMPPYGSAGGTVRTFDDDNDEYYYSLFTMMFLRQYCTNLRPKIQKILDEVDKIFGAILGKAGEHEDLMYQQMHTLFHQWQILGAKADGTRINQPGNPAILTPNVAIHLQEQYGTINPPSDTPGERERSDGNTLGGGFRFDYPLQARGANSIKVEDSIINMDPLFSAKANTTVLNMFQQLCQKNNFMFFPICGNARYDKVTDIFAPQEMMGPRIGNFFQIMFQPTPESRTLQSNNPDIKQSSVKDLTDFQVEAFPVAFGDPTNKIIKNVQVSTDENKVTAESIVNLQSIVDNENKNRTVTTDCSLLSVFEGRSYKAGIETLGNAQISPLQFFYLQNHTIFTGLYQIIKVSHKISPNDMTTDLSGIKMRYGGNTYGGIVPITLRDFEEAGAFVKNAPMEAVKNVASAGAAAAFAKAQENALSNNEVYDNASSGGGSSGGNYAVTGTEAGAYTVKKYLRDKNKKRRIDKIIKECVKRGIKSDYAIAALLGICSKESSFDLKAEGFCYSAGRLPDVWNYFKKNDPVKGGFVNPKTLKADSDKYQEKIANLVYVQQPVGLRERGYGNTKAGDGWKYRGRGYNQITFKSGYEAAAKNSGVDVVKYPDRLLEEDVATAALVGFFDGRRNTRKFGNKTSGYMTPKEGYGCTDKGVTFPNLKNAVFFYYHLNTGPGKSVGHIKDKLKPGEKLGGMQRAQSRAPSFVEYIRQNFKDQGVVISRDPAPTTTTPSDNETSVSSTSSSSTSSSSSGGDSSAYAGMVTWDKHTTRRIKTLHPKMRAKVTEFIIRADKELGIKIRVASALRTFEEQTALYAKGRTTKGSIVTYAKAGSSLHNYGLAIDIVEIKDGKALWNSPNEAKISRLGKSVGFDWGGDWSSFKDKPHYEMKFGNSLKTLKRLYDSGQKDGAYVKI